MVFFAVMLAAFQSAGQTVMGILPVNVSAVSSSVLDDKQWQAVSTQLGEYLSTELNSVGTINKLSREHILLLLKEMPSPDPENLDAEAYKIISKKEKLNYLVKCSIESIEVTDKNVLAPIRIIIIDGSSGKVFWEKVEKTGRLISTAELTEHILLKEILKPSVALLSKEMKSLKY
jgi:hypothetical protein